MLEKKTRTVLESASISAQNFESRFSSYFFDEGKFSNKNYNYFFLVQKKPEIKKKSKNKNRKSGFEVLLGIRCRFQNCPCFFFLALMVFDFYSFENYPKNTPQKTGKS